MLLAYDATGTVVFQLGMISTMPDGPPDEDLPAMFAEAGVSPAGWVRLHDAEDAELVERVLRCGARVVDGQVQPGEEPVPPPMTGVDLAPVTRAELDALQAHLDAVTALIVEAQ